MPRIADILGIMNSRGKGLLAIVLVVVGLVGAFWVLRLQSQSATQQAALRVAAQNAFDTICDESTPVGLRENRLDATADNRLAYATETWKETTEALGLTSMFIDGWDLTSLANEIDQLSEADLKGQTFDEAVDKLEGYCDAYVGTGRYEREFS